MLSGPRARGGARAARRRRRRSPSCARCSATRPADPAHVLRVLEQLEVHVGETPQPDRVQVATPGGDPGAPLRGRVLLRPPGGRVPARRRRPSRSSRTTTGARSRPRAGSCSPCARTGSTASATCSTSAPRAPSALLVLSSRSSDEEGNPQAESYFVDDVRELLADGAELRTRSLSDVTWRPEDAPTAAEWDRAHAAAGPRRPERAARAAQLRAAARRAVRARGRGRRARSRTSPTARSSGSSRTC